jgi:hypothetical protein
MRALVPVTAACCAVGLMSTAAWADTPAPRPAPHPAPIAHPNPPPPIGSAECTRRGGRPVPDPHHPRARHCQGGPFNGREVR